LPSSSGHLLDEQDTDKALQPTVPALYTTAIPTSVFYPVQRNTLHLTVVLCSHPRMSSTSATKNEYLVILPDHANSLQKRLAVRPKHFAGLTPHIQSGDVVFGGAILSGHPKEGETPDMTGSAMLIKAESEEAVREWIANDAYAKGDVWNLDEAKIYPFRCAVRTAM
jgi:uncharacterized protein